MDGGNNAYVTGMTESGGTFPEIKAVDRCSANIGVFVTKVRAAASSLAYSTCLDGRRSDIGTDIAVDVARRAYVTGHTGSSGAFFTEPFPTTAGAFQRSFAGGALDGFVAKLSP